MRQEYELDGLDEEAAGSDPFALFVRWLDDAVAAGMHEPNAVGLATATTDGRPSLRFVLLKGFDTRGAVFYTNVDSRKGLELAANPHAALTMPWHPLQRQVRLEGIVSQVPAAESDAYFAQRPRGSQIGALASPQSRVVADRAELERLVAEAEQVAGDGDVERPASWGGYRLVPESFEFWQGRLNRLHDRIRFVREGDAWLRERLAP